MSGLFRTSSSKEESEWLSVSDLMAGLMVIFLFIAIISERRTPGQEDLLPEPPIDAEQEDSLLGTLIEVDIIDPIPAIRIYEALLGEFQTDLATWKAEIEKDTLLIRFKSPEVLFAQGSSQLKPRFKKILDDFFPRYARVLLPFKESIAELRIEGHTSSIWKGATTEQESYFLNMELSQGRTRSVLQYVLTLPSLYPNTEWVQPLLTANGLSFSKRIVDYYGRENREASRRVEFRVRIKAQKRTVRILEDPENHE